MQRACGGTRRQHACGCSLPADGWTRPLPLERFAKACELGGGGVGCEGKGVAPSARSSTHFAYDFLAPRRFTTALAPLPATLPLFRPLVPVGAGVVVLDPSGLGMESSAIGHQMLCWTENLSVPIASMSVEGGGDD